MCSVPVLYAPVGAPYDDIMEAFATTAYGSNSFGTKVIGFASEGEVIATLYSKLGSGSYGIIMNNTNVDIFSYKILYNLTESNLNEEYSFYGTVSGASRGRGRYNYGMSSSVPGDVFLAVQGALETAILKGLTGIDVTTSPTILRWPKLPINTELSDVSSSAGR